MGNNGFGNFPADPVLDFGSAGYLDGNNSEAALTVEYSFDNGSVITAIAGYSEYEFERFLDADFNPLPALRFDDHEDFDQTSLELRLTSDTGGRFEYIVGGYYQDSELFSDGLTQFSLDTLNTLLGGSCAAGGGAGAIVPGNPGLTAATVAATVPGSTAGLANACGNASLLGVLVPAGGQWGVPLRLPGAGLRDLGDFQPDHLEHD